MQSCLDTEITFANFRDIATFDKIQGKSSENFVKMDLLLLKL